MLQVFIWLNGQIYIAHQMYSVIGSAEWIINLLSHRGSNEWAAGDSGLRGDPPAGWTHKLVGLNPDQPEEAEAPSCSAVYYSARHPYTASCSFTLVLLLGVSDIMMSVPHTLYVTMNTSWKTSNNGVFPVKLLSDQHLWPWYLFLLGLSHD